MHLCDLWNVKVRSVDGRRLGRVHDVHLDKGRIVALACGPGSLLERLTAKARGRRIPWEHVKQITKAEILVALEPASNKHVRASSASRTRPGTRRASGRRSKR